MLCDTCADIFNRVYDSTVSESSSGLTVKIAYHDPGETSCQICAFINLKMGDILAKSNQEPDRTKKKQEIEYSISFNPSTNPRVKRPPRLYFHSPGSVGIFFNMISIEGLDSPIKTRHVPHNTLSVSSWKLTADWLDNCIRNHPRCNIQMQSPWMPTRLIYLKMEGKQLRPQLRIFEGGKTVVPYATLSHCWGGANVIKLQMSNIEDMCTNIHLKTLPKTFQDAFFVASSLRIEYIWIDSLCIIQDSKQDWIHEALRMGDVYKNSRLNIAATGAVDSDGGCFFSRDPALVEPSRIEVAWKSNEGVTMCAYHLMCESPQGEFEEARLNRRAWVQQERLLSSRVLHFGNQQLVWECRELEACETYPNGLALDGMVQEPNKKSFLFDLERRVDDEKKSLLKLFDANEPTFFHQWMKIVTSYSCSGLTMIEDRLIALQGIVSEMKNFCQDDYLAGLWRRSLLPGMLWKPDGDCFHPKVYRAPSWSWLSVEGGVSFGSCLQALRTDLYSIMPSVSNASVEYDQENPSIIISGSITLTGRIGLTSWHEDETYLNSKRILYRLTTIYDWDGSPATGNLPEHWQKIVKPSIVSFDIRENGHHPPRRLYCLPLIFVLEDPFGDETTDGLLLIRDESGVFRRVGCFWAGEYVSRMFENLSEHTITII